MEFTGLRFLPTQELLTYEIGYEHLHRYYSIAPVLKNKKVLDIACGEGYGSAIISSYAASSIGVDLDQEVINEAKTKYAEINNLSFICGSAASIPCEDDSFDVVVSFETIEHLSEEMQEQFMNEIKRVMVPGGVLIMSTPNKDNYTIRYNNINPFHKHEFNENEYTQFINKHFKHYVLYNQGFEVVGIIDNQSTRNEPIINQINYSQINDYNEVKRKYFIVIASNEEHVHSEYKISSLLPKVNVEYYKLIDRILDLQKEVESLGKWGKELDQEKLKLSDRILDLQKEVESLGKWGKELDQENSKLRSENNYVNNFFTFQEDKFGQILNSKELKMLLKIYDIKKRHLSHDSPLSIRINSFIRFFKKKKRSVKNDVKYDFDFKLDTDKPLTIPTFDTIVVSIIIPVYNEWGINYSCIKSIIDNTPESVAYEIILADDCSVDTTKNCKNIIQNLIHAPTSSNVGFLKNCNNAAKFAKGEYILFLNNDTVVIKNWLAPLVDLMVKDEKIGIVGSKLIFPNGKLQEAGGIIWKNASGWNYGRNLDPSAPEFNYVKEVDYISGASLMIRKYLWNQAGGFDNRYSPAYCEDSDLAFMVRQMGYKVIYQPLSEVIHFEGFSHGKDTVLKKKKKSIKSFQEINKSKFYDKWKDSLLKYQLPNAQNVFCARDRSLNKKTIVVIDHYVPHPDKDAGSITTFQYLELFVSMGLNVKFIGDNFFREEPYTTTLQQMGIEVLYGNYYSKNWEEWIIENNLNIDFFYLNRPHISLKYIHFLKKNTNAKILFYGHDLHFLREQRRFEIEKDTAILALISDWKLKENILFEKSDIILTPNLDEGKIISQLNKAYRVEVILPFFYNKNAVPVKNFEQRKSILFIGGFNHLPNIDAVQWFVNEVWPIVIKQIPDATFFLAGSNPTEEILSLESNSIKILGYQTEKELEDLYTKIKIAVIPLRYGAGVKGKTIEAMYNGVPIVSTSFGLEGIPPFDETFLPKCDEAVSFAHQIITLYNDNQKLEILSEYETNYINKFFTNDIAKKTMSRLLEIDN